MDVQDLEVTGEIEVNAPISPAIAGHLLPRVGSTAALLLGSLDPADVSLVERRVETIHDRLVLARDEGPVA